jgi:hypothetical protein
MTKQLLVLTVVVLLTIGTTCLFSKVKVGDEVLQKIESPHPYNGVKGMVWEKEFYWPNAGYIAIHFSAFDLSPRDYVEVSSPDGKFHYKYKGKGKLLREGKTQTSEFWATHIPGEKAIVRLFSKSRKGGWGFVIDKWAHGYERDYIEGILASLRDDGISQIESVCSSDDKEWAKCYEDTTMYYNSRAVVRLLINGISACTGWLLGEEGHLMTNNHCIDSQNDADNTDYEFMAEGETCTTDCSSGGACPGEVEAYSGILVQNDGDLDYSLIKLSTSLNRKYGYLQFRNILPTVGERIYIPQHPGAWGKQIAVNSDVDGLYAKIYSTDETPCTGGTGDIGYYADTAGGSSGSPVIAYKDHLVVALHHCSNCPNRGVQIPSIITDLSSNLPDNAIRYSYCTSSASNQDYEWIARVKMGSLDNSSVNSEYSNFTYLATTITKGAEVEYTLTPGYSGSTNREYWKIWIDYNRDGDFSDYGERVLSRSGKSTLSGGFFVPFSAQYGVTRMRISMQYNSVPSECGTFTYGEVEDYSVYIK